MKKKFNAKHYLGFVDGKEGEEHEHDYELEVKLKGEELKKLGYLMDLTELEPILDSIVKKYEGKLLNDLDIFKDNKPTVENFSKIIWEEISTLIKNDNVEVLTVKIWESDIASASYQNKL